MADHVPTTPDVKTDQAQSAEQQALQAKRARQTHAPRGSADAQRGTASVLQGGAAGMNYADGSTFVAPGGPGQDALRPNAYGQNIRGRRSAPKPDCSVGSHHRDDTSSRGDRGGMDSGLVKVELNTPEEEAHLQQLVEQWATDGAKKVFIKSSGGQHVVNNLRGDSLAILLNSTSVEVANKVVGARLSKAYNCVEAAQSIHQHVNTTLQGFDDHITRSEAVLSAPLRVLARQSTRFIQGRPSLAPWKAKLHRAMLAVEAHPSSATLNSLASVADEASTEFHKYLSAMSDGADAMVQGQRYTVFASAAVVGAGSALLSGGATLPTLLTAASQGTMLGSAALTASEAYNTLHQAWEAGQSVNLFDSVLGVLEKYLSATSFDADRPGFSLEAGITGHVPLLSKGGKKKPKTESATSGVSADASANSGADKAADESKFCDANASVVLGGGVSLAYSDNREWEVSVAADIGLGGELHLFFTEFEAAAAGGLGMQSASPSLVAALTSLIFRFNEGMWNILVRSLPSGVAGLLPRTFVCLEEAKLTRLTQLLSKEEAAEAKAKAARAEAAKNGERKPKEAVLPEQVNVNDVTEVKSVNGQVNAGLNLGDQKGKNAKTSNGAPSAELGFEGGYSSSAQDMTTDGYRSRQTTTAWEGSKSLAVDPGVVNGDPKNKKPSVTGAITVGTENIAGDICLDNNGDYAFLTVSLSAGIGASDDIVPKIVKSVLDGLVGLGREHSYSRGELENALGDFSKHKTDTSLSGELSFTITKLSGKVLHNRVYMTVGASSEVNDGNSGHHGGAVGGKRRSKPNRKMNGSSSVKAEADASLTIPIYERMGTRSDAYFKQSYMRNRIGGTYMEGDKKVRRSWWKTFLSDRSDELKELFINTAGEPGLAGLLKTNASAFKAKYEAWLDRKERAYFQELGWRKDSYVMAAATDLANLWRNGAKDRVQEIFATFSKERQEAVLVILSGLGHTALIKALKRK